VRVEAITGLVKEQVDEVVVRVARHLGTGECCPRSPPVHAS
jgi:hypothetical protein